MAKEKALPEGIYAAALTPFHPDLSCNVTELYIHCQSLLQRGCQGIVLFGTTGEGPSFSQKERIDILNQMIEMEFPAEKILVANGSSGIAETVELAIASLKHGCNTLLIVPPSFYKNIKDDGVISYYREIITKVGNPNLKVILYHIPQYSGISITLNIIRKLMSEFPSNIVGMKESEGNLFFAKAFIDAFPSLQLFVGNERQIIETVNYGGAGAICGIANLYPELMVSLYDQGKIGLSPNPPQLEAVFEALKDIPFIAAAKSFMEKEIGEEWQTLRPPLIPLDAKIRDLFLSKLTEYQ
ncbi:MAG TPA: dihydrodipicolinate synthase family protein [Chlamydiales bacterium]|nr:dihydrodipicolinate synthase family protein [Chlamydiales bacterium]